MDALEMIKMDLRIKYLKDRDDLQRQVANDSEQWTDEKMMEAAERMSQIDELLKTTEFLKVSDGNDSSVIELPNYSINGRMMEEILCPVCMEEMRGNILCCSNSHPVCAECVKVLQDCPSCRQSYLASKPVRNRFAESLITAFLKL